MTRTTAVLLDVDGTLLDSTEAHARSWFDVLRQHGHDVSLDDLRAAIGKGSDKLLPELVDLPDDSAEAKQLKDARKTLFEQRLLPALQPTRGARALVQRLHAQGLRVVVATSSGPNELRGLLRQAGVEDLLPVATTAQDAASSKPDPDIVGAALRKVGATADEAVMIGDTPFDVTAARRAGVRCIALRCGGFWNDAALAEAVALYDDPADLLDRFDTSVLAG